VYEEASKYLKWAEIISEGLHSGSGYIEKFQFKIQPVDTKALSDYRLVASAESHSLFVFTQIQYSPPPLAGSALWSCRGVERSLWGCAWHKLAEPRIHGKILTSNFYLPLLIDSQLIQTHHHTGAGV
jgi:hypothetical protein